MVVISSAELRNNKKKYLDLRNDTDRQKSFPNVTLNVYD